MYPENGNFHHGKKLPAKILQLFPRIDDRRDRLEGLLDSLKPDSSFRGENQFQSLAEKLFPEYNFHEGAGSHNIALFATRFVGELLHRYGDVPPALLNVIDFLPEKGRKVLLQYLIFSSEYPEVRSASIAMIAQIQNPLARWKLYYSAARFTRKLVSIENGTGIHSYLYLIKEFPRQWQRSLFEYIFHSSFHHYQTQLKAIHLLKGIGDEALIMETMERIVKMKEVNELLIFESLDLLNDLGPDSRLKIQNILLRNAPYDSVLLRVIDSFHLVSGMKNTDSFFKYASKSLKMLFSVENEETRNYAVSLISRFPEKYRYNLILKVFSSHYVKSCLTAIQGVITLNDGFKFSILRSAILRNLPLESEKNLLVQAVRMISFLPLESRSFLYQLAGDRIAYLFEVVIKNGYYSGNLYVMPALELIPAGENRISLERLGCRAVESVLLEKRKGHQSVAVHMIPFLPVGMQTDLIKKALRTEYNELVNVLLRIVQNMPEKTLAELEPFYIERLVSGYMKDELRGYSLETILNQLIKNDTTLPFRLYQNLYEMRLFTVPELYRFLGDAALRALSVPAKVLNVLNQNVKSDNEKISFIREVLFPFAQLWQDLASLDRRSFLRLALIRIRNREKGFASDMGMVLKDHFEKNLSLSNDAADLRSFFRETEIKVYDNIVFEIYRSLTVEEKVSFVSILDRLNESILSGTGYGDLKQEIERSGIVNSVNDEFIFGILMQLIPIDSVHLNRGDAKRIFQNALSLEDEILLDLRRNAPSLIAPGESSGMRIVRPSTESIRTQSRPFEFTMILKFLQEAMKPEFGVEPGEMKLIFLSQSMEDVNSFLSSYLFFQLSDQLKEVNYKFQSSRTRYEALLMLDDILSETIYDVLRSGVNRMRQRYDRDSINAGIRNLQKNTGVDITGVRFIGRIKPGALYNLLLKSYLNKGRSLADFFVENVMELDAVNPGHLSWRKFIQYLSEGSNHGYCNPDLAMNIENYVNRIERSDNERRIVLSQEDRSTDPLFKFFKNSISAFWSGLSEELGKAILSYDTIETINSPDVVYQIGKSAWLSIFGGLADICIARDEKLFARDNFTLLSFIQDMRYVGFSLIHFVEDETLGKCMVLAGCEPSHSYVARHDPGDIYLETVSVLKEFARIGGINYVLQIAEENALSNRDRIKRYIKRNIYKERPDGFLKKPLYLGSYGISTFKSAAYFIL